MRIATIYILFLAAVFAAECEASAEWRRRRRHQEEDSNVPPSVEIPADESNGQPSSALKQMLRTSPKDALIVTKRRYLRKDWCKSQPLIQRIGQDRCLSTTVLNRFCYGQCNSFYIPRNDLKADGRGQQHAASDETSGTIASGRAFRSCAVCQPKKTSWVTVTLKCPSLVPNYRRRRVQIVNQCRCMQESPS